MESTTRVELASQRSEVFVGYRYPKWTDKTAKRLFKQAKNSF